MFSRPITIVSRGQKKALDKAAVEALYRPTSDVSITPRHESNARFTAQRCLCHPGTGLLQLKGPLMAKGNNSKRGNKEAKKPKQEKPKVSATANSLAGKLPLAIGGKKVK